MSILSNNKRRLLGISSAQVHEQPSVFECPSALIIRMPDGLKFPSALRLHCECPSGKVPCECPSTLRVFWMSEYLLSVLRILTGKKHPKIKLQRLRKIRILTFGSLVHQINFFQEVLKLEQIFQKSKLVTGKTPLFVIGPFCSRHSIVLTLASDRAVLNGNEVRG